MVHVRPLSDHRSPTAQGRNRRERTRLLSQRDRLGNRSKFAAATIERAEERIAALALRIADVDRRMLELGAEVPT